MKKSPVFLIAFLAVLIFNSGSKGQCFTAWQYYLPIKITNNVSSSLSDYQVKVIVNTASLVSSSKMTSTGDDIRFVDPLTCNTLNYWIESGINTSTTTIWVKLPSLNGSASKTIRMYYGNSSASAVSNGDSTFVLFDDFNGSSINTSKWNIYGQSGSNSVSSGIATLSTPTTGRYLGEVIVSTGSFSSNVILEENLTSVNGYWNGLGIFNSGSYNGYSCFSGTTSTTNTMNTGAVNHNYSAFGAAKTSVNSSPGTLTGIWQFSWPSTGTQNVAWPGGTLSGSGSGTTLGSSVQVGVGMITESNGSISIDWIRLRTYAAKEASSSNGAEAVNGQIVVSAISGSPFCTAGSISINVPFTINAAASFSSGNVFTAQISDSAGSFSSPVDIGTLTSVNAGTISATIPAGGYGMHYKIRVINSTNALYNSQPGPSILVIAPRAKPGINVNAGSQCIKTNSFSFTNTTSGTGAFTYNWSYGDGNTSNATSPVYTYTNPGKYIVKLTATNIAGCTDTVSEVVNVNNAIAAFAVNNNEQCFNGNAFSFTNKSSGFGALTYLWNFGDGNTSTSASPSAYSYSASGTYVVKLYTTSNGSCTDSAQQSITVNPKVFAGFKTNNALQCLNSQNLVFTNNTSVSSGSLSYKWSFGDGSAISTLANPSHTYKNAGNYIIKLTANSDKGCFDTISKLIQIVPTPGATIKAGSELSFCQGSQVVLSGNAGTGYAYQWLKNGFKISPSGTNQTYTAVAGGSYSVIVSNTNGCSDTSSPSKVIVFPNPPKPVITQTGRVLKSTKSIAYQWMLNGANINGADSLTYHPDVNTGSFTVMITDSNGCNNTSDAYKYDVSAVNPDKTLKDRVLIYPNPARDKFYINLDENTRDIQNIQILDINGRIVNELQLSSGDRSVEVSVHGLLKGMYFIRFSGVNNSFMEKIAVQ